MKIDKCSRSNLVYQRRTQEYILSANAKLMVGYSPPEQENSSKRRTAAGKAPNGFILANG